MQGFYALFYDWMVKNMHYFIIEWLKKMQGGSGGV